MIIIKTKGEITNTGDFLTFAKADLEWLKKQVGGYVQVIKVLHNGRRVDMAVDDEGRLKNKPINFVASYLAGQTIVGDVVLFNKEPFLVNKVLQH
jgi:hypothetical protein